MSKKKPSNRFAEAESIVNILTGILATIQFFIWLFKG